MRQQWQLSTSLGSFGREIFAQVQESLADPQAVADLRATARADGEEPPEDREPGRDRAGRPRPSAINTAWQPRRQRRNSLSRPPARSPAARSQLLGASLRSLRLPRSPLVGSQKLSRPLVPHRPLSATTPASPAGTVLLSARPPPLRRSLSATATAPEPGGPPPPLGRPPADQAEAPGAYTRLTEELDELAAAERRELRALLDGWGRRVERRRQEHVARQKEALRRLCREAAGPTRWSRSDIGEAPYLSQQGCESTETLALALGAVCNLDPAQELEAGEPAPADAADPRLSQKLELFVPADVSAEEEEEHDERDPAGRPSLPGAAAATGPDGPDGPGDGAGEGPDGPAPVAQLELPPDAPRRGTSKRNWASCPAPTASSPRWRRKPDEYVQQPKSAARRRRGSVFQSLDGDEAGRNWAERLTQSRGYEWFSFLLIFTNAVFIGYQTEWTAQTANDLADQGLSPNTPEPTSFIVIQCMFCLMFSVELGLRWIADGTRELFIHTPDRWWNVFDVFIVLLTLVDMMSSIIEKATSSDNNIMVNISVLRVARVVRIIRVAKVIRVMRFFRELRMMIYSILGSMKSLLWAMIVLLLMFFIFGISLTVGTVQHLDSPDVWQSNGTRLLRKYFGTLFRSIVTLYAAMSGGLNWGEPYDVLTEVSTLYALLFLLFVTVAIFAVGNIVTGIFVDTALQSNQKDKDALVQDELEARRENFILLQEVFEELDTDGSGIVTLEHLEAKLDDERVIAYLNVLELEVSDARMLFTLLDYDQSGGVAIEEFIAGCHRLKGESRSLDLAIMQHELRWLMEAFVNFADFMEVWTAGTDPRPPPSADGREEEDSADMSA